ncbi:MAG: sialidase family protein, partial [Chthoniobacterales bacterium]
MRLLPRALFCILAALSASVLLVRHTAAQQPPPLESFDRNRLPEALRNVPLEHLSTGALLRLDQDGDLVESPSSWAARIESRATTNGAAIQAAAVSLDRRVGANIRLGDDPTNLPSTMRAQAEPHIARSPTNPDFLLGVFQDGRFVDGGAVDCGYAVSHDGGLTWTRALIPYVSTTSGGPYLRATDPVAGIDLNGRAFLNTIGATNSQFTTGAILVSRSLDGGLTFEPPAVIYQ